MGTDAYYVATPPREHRAFALLCLGASKPVLEKPLAMDSAAAEEIVDAARSRSVLCMEGMWTRFRPLVRGLKQLVDGGANGEMRAVTGSFSGATTPSVGRGRLLNDGGYRYEADEVMRCVRAGALESHVMPLSESLDIVRLMTRAQAHWTESHDASMKRRRRACGSV